MKWIATLILGASVLLIGAGLMPLPAIAGDHDGCDDIDIVEPPFPEPFDDDPFPEPFEFPEPAPEETD